MRYLSALAFVVCLFIASVSEAQTVAQIANLSQQFREGTSTTASVDLPANLSTIADEIWIVLDIQAPVYEDPTTRLAIRLYRLIPATGLWQYAGGSTFNGGRYVDEDGIVNPPITFGGAASIFAGYTVRAEIETNARVRLGATVSTVKY